MIADIWSDCKEQFEKRKAGEQKDEPAFHSERLGTEQWRLTSEGVVARGDLNGDATTVCDFVLKLGFFDGRPRLLPDGRISQRLPVDGRGVLERVQWVRAGETRTEVNVGNWTEGAKAFAAAFTELVKTLRPTTDTPPSLGNEEGTQADPFAELRRFAADRLKGQERATIEALCDAGGALPLGDLAIAAGWNHPQKSFESVQRRLNQKLRRHKYRISRHDNAARLVRTG